jgi:hypothetical protein
MVEFGARFARQNRDRSAEECLEAKRHFDDLGFESGTEPPMWDDEKSRASPTEDEQAHSSAP